MKQDTLYAKYIESNNDYNDLLLDNFYEVTRIDMGQSYTSISLRNKSKGFNSIYFSFYKNGKEIDIYNSPEYNPYYCFFT